MFIDSSTGLTLLASVVASLMALFIAAPFHEFAHAYAAKREGDYTAVALRRCTLAPHAHFDFVGFVCIFLFGFGWAKPVPIDSRNFKRGRKSQFIVSIAGIVANLILGTFFLFALLVYEKFATIDFLNSIFGYILYVFLNVSYSLNFMLAFFNLLPIYPLDGYNLIDSFCRQDNQFLQFMRKYSFIIYILLIATGAFSIIYFHTFGYLIEALIKIFTLILGI